MLVKYGADEKDGMLMCWSMYILSILNAASKFGQVEKIIVMSDLGFSFVTLLV